MGGGVGRRTALTPDCIRRRGLEVSRWRSRTEWVSAARAASDSFQIISSSLISHIPGRLMNAPPDYMLSLSTQAGFLEEAD